MVYRKYSTYLKDRYGEKIYKLPIKINGSCPNRDGTIGWGGCSYCGEEGGSFENLDGSLSVKSQIETNKAYISKKYKAKKFIAYLQNFTNTYMPIDRFKESIYQALGDDIVAIYISTRPDSITDQQLSFLKKIKEAESIDILFELGLQSVNYKILKDMNRGHGLAEFIDACLRIRAYDFEICTHMIVGLPMEERIDVVEGARILSSLKVDQVKLHALYLVKNTVYGSKYLKGELEVISLEEYKTRVILFLRNLSPEIVVQRLIGRSSEEDSLFSNWGVSWWKIQDEIISEMEASGFYQGDLFDGFSPIEKES